MLKFWISSLFVFWTIPFYSHAGEDTRINRPAASTELVKSTRACFGVWIDPKKWKLNPNANELFQKQFLYANSREALGVFNAETSIVSLDTVIEGSIEKFKAGGILLKTKERRVLAGKEVTFLTLEGYDERKGPIAAHGIYYSGPEGTVQLVVFFDPRLPEEYKQDMQSFVDGLQIGDADAKAPPEHKNQGIAIDSDAMLRFTEIALPVPQTTAPVDTPLLKQKLLEKAKKGNASAQLQLALIYAEEKEEASHAQAVELMQKAVAANLCNAEAELGLWYVTGKMGTLDREKGERLLRKAANAGEPHAQTNLGWVLASSDPTTAAEWHRKAAKQGLRDAEFNLGLAYQNGIGVDQNFQEAFKWFQKAAEHGHRAAMENMAAFYFEGHGVEKNLQEAVRLLREAAHAGSPQAQLKLGICYLNGMGTISNAEEGIGWLHKAADQGEGSAQDILGQCYEKGIGVSKDASLSLEWYEKAAHSNIHHAQLMTGIGYRSGQGVAKNVCTAMDWLNKAAANGNVPALVFLGDIYFQGKEVTQDLPQAVSYFRKAAEAGDPQGMSQLGYCYWRGIGVEKDSANALRWLRKAANKGILGAQLSLGCLLMNDPLGPEDYEEAQTWLRKAAEQGDPRAQCELGLYLVNYLNRPGIVASPEEGVQWLRFAALQGLPRAETAYGYSLTIGAGVTQDLIEAYKWNTLVIEQETDLDAKRNSEVNMRILVPKMTPEQIEEGKNRAKKFVPVRDKNDEHNPLSLTLG